MTLSPVERAKQEAAKLAVIENVHDEMIVGIGSGSTIVYAVKEIAAMVEKNDWNIVCIPTSYQAEALIINNHLPLGSLDQHPHVDVTIDGVDEITLDLTAIKGGGGCLVQEKIVADNSIKLVIIGDWKKVSMTLGESWKKGVPIEIIAKAQIPLTQRLKEMGGKVKLREGKAKIGPLITDNGNFILDVNFGKIIDPKKLSTKLKSMIGVVDSGLFVNMVDKAYIGQEDGTVKILS